MLRCKISLACKRPIAYVVHRSNAVPDRAVCFLGRFLPKLGGATSVAIFLPVSVRGEGTGSPCQAGDEPGDAMAHPQEAGQPLYPALVHVEFSRDLDL